MAKLPSGLKIEPTTTDQIPSFWSCFDSVAREKQYLLSSQAHPLEKLERFVEQMTVLGNPQVLACIDDEVVGWCDVRRLDQPGLRHTGELGMGVIKEWRGQGIGKALLKDCVARAFAVSIEKIQLNVFTSNEAAVSLYRNFGFAEEGLMKDYARLNNESKDAYRMALFAPGHLQGNR